MFFPCMRAIAYNGWSVSEVPSGARNLGERVQRSEPDTHLLGDPNGAIAERECNETRICVVNPLSRGCMAIRRPPFFLIFQS